MFLFRREVKQKHECSS